MNEPFQGSIAQKNVQFPIETVVTPLAGENYSKAMVFIALSEAAGYLPGVVSPAANTLTEVKSSTYVELTGGLLKKWLAPFFSQAAAVPVGVVIYDDDEEATLDLATCFDNFKMYGYFKFICTGTSYSDAQVALSTLCLAEPLYSQHWIGTSDQNVLTGESTLISALNTAGSNSRVVYNIDTDINPALAQLGATLKGNNATGTPVGNDIDMRAFGTIAASGAAVDGVHQNLSASDKLSLDNQKIGYNTWVGDGSGAVVTEGSLTLKSKMVGAYWVKHYIEYMCKVKTANYITQGNKFRNNDTYQGILAILADQVRGFVNFGRLANFEITAPAFRDLPASGDTFVVSNAWKATYIDNVREVTVYGDLYITNPTR